VVDLMIERLSRLPQASLAALKRLACLGNSVAIERLQQVIEASEQETQALLHEPLRVGLLHQIDAAYAFAHDRVHEAAYALLQESERAAVHRSIGMHLLAALGESEVDAEIFDIASHFNRSDIAGADAPERASAAELNLRARRAIISPRAARSSERRAGAPTTRLHSRWRWSTRNVPSSMAISTAPKAWPQAPWTTHERAWTRLRSTG
jgi:predicted ATPase